ncbi:hypothetical protein AVEN_129812-1 [Araneus ventricosus]|uniref:Speckle-type POZ protein n=1 Tax=Araneus ventricosus TaxID=182803 RepID=A0A4Y2RQ86_ARAVE|nr:hypothetical protein AVEN_129812-1 [Araneus ventricosus]
MAFVNSEERCYTFLWKLENISYCLEKKGKRIESPSFVVDAIDQTKWKLCFYPRGDSDEDWIACYLHREADSKGASSVKIKYELALIKDDGSELKSTGIIENTFSKNSGFGRSKFLKREDVFLTERSIFLQQDTLTARCRIWKSVGQMPVNVRCYARTRIGVRKRSSYLKLENFSTLESDVRSTYQVTSLESYEPLIDVDFTLTGGISSFSGGIIRFGLSLYDRTVKYCALRLNLVDASGVIVNCNQEEFWFDGSDQSLVVLRSPYPSIGGLSSPVALPCHPRKEFTFFFTKKQLMAMKSVYLIEDILTIHWELALSKGILSSEAEKVEIPILSEQNVCTSSESNFSNIYDKKVSLSNDLIDNVKSLYDEKFLCDVKLKTNTSVFPAHKVILSASSSVFKAMFSSSVIGKDSDSINIEGLSDDTINQMLLYIYTTRVEDLTWASASRLYVGAHKYAIISLKSICSTYLKENLSVDNACHTLLLVRSCLPDDSLKSAAQDYILKYGQSITNTNGWKVLMKFDRNLAAETLRLR